MAIATSTAIIAGSLIAAGGVVAGSMAQADALEAAGDIQGAIQLRELAFQERVFQAGAPFRDIALEEAESRLDILRETLPLISEDILREPGTSAFFKSAFKSGVKGISETLAPFGLSPESSTFGEAVGLFGEKLTAGEIEDIRNRRFALAGFGAQGISPTTGIGEAIAAGPGDGGLANLITAGGAVRGGLFGALGSQFAQLPLLLSLTGGGGGFAVSPTTA